MEEHKRRMRYNGTHPKSFQEKYKEQQPEKYPDEVEKIIQKGNTPAGMHISICVKEILEFLTIQPGQIGLDATLGYGGHTKAMLDCLNGTGHLYALDVDAIEIVKTRERLEKLGYGAERLTVKQLNFANIATLLDDGAGPFAFVLADLGLSSMQLDNPERGFSYKKDGPLDLRLNPEQGISASARLRELCQEEIEGMLQENADEPYARQIAQTVADALKKGTPIETTAALRALVEKALAFLPANKRKDLVKKSCQRTFQALRIDVNSEFEVLHQFLETLPNVLESGGRVAILSFHSGEDRLVKKAFKRLRQEGIYSEVATEVIRPSAEECIKNSRARSAKMRWAIKA